MDTEDKKDLKEIALPIVIVMVVFIGIFIYWLNSSFYQDTKAQQREAMRQYLMAAYSDEFICDTPIMYPPWSRLEKQMKKWNLTYDDIDPFKDFERRNKALEELIGKANGSTTKGTEQNH